MPNNMLVKEFHQAMGEIPNKPTVPQLQTMLLRRKLIQEEWQESEIEWQKLFHQQKVEVKDLEFLIHELGDLLYATLGAFIEIGIDVDEILKEIHKANMQKIGGKCREDGKLLKPNNWQPANIKKFLEQS